MWLEQSKKGEKGDASERQWRPDHVRLGGHCSHQEAISLGAIGRLRAKK